MWETPNIRCLENHKNGKLMEQHILRILLLPGVKPIAVKNKYFFVITGLWAPEVSGRSRLPDSVTSALEGLFTSRSILVL
jgi:hypothetical protein